MSINPYCSLVYERNGVVCLTISGAGRANILGTPVIEGLIAGLAALADDTELRALVLAGTGNRTFVGGADLEEMKALDCESAQRFISRLRDLCEAVRLFPVPVVARLAGWCLGGGLELAMACDLRVASDTAQFAMPEVKVGIPSVIHAALLPRFVGVGRARWMILTGEPIDAATAFNWGLVDAVVPLDDLDTAVAAALAPILACEPEVIRSQKALMRQWDELPLSEAVAASIPVFGRAFTTGEPQRRMRAFFDRKGR